MSKNYNSFNEYYIDGLFETAKIIGGPLTIELREEVKDPKFLEKLIRPNYLICPLIERGCKTSIEHSPSCCHLAPSRKYLPLIIGSLLE